MTLINHPQKTISVDYKKLKTKAAAVTFRNEDGSYTIFLNSMYCYERLRQALDHELKHIDKDHHDGGEINDIELSAREKQSTEPTIFGIPVSEYRERCRKAAASRRKRMVAKYYRERKKGEIPYWERMKGD